MTPEERWLARIVATLGIGLVALLAVSLVVLNYAAIRWSALALIIALLTYAVLHDGLPGEQEESVDG